MNKYLNIVIAVAVVSIFIVTIAHASTTYFNQNLYYGTHGNDVFALQEFLTEGGYYNGPISGNFYSLTLAGVKAFQKGNALPSTGYFGILSRGVANSILQDEIQTPPLDEVGTTTATSTAGDNLIISTVPTTTQSQPQALAPAQTQTPSQTLTTQPTPMPAPQFIGTPVVTITRGDNINTYQIDWTSDIPSTSSFNMCIGVRDPSACTMQKEFDQATGFTYQIVRPNSSAEFFSIGITANGLTTWYYAQFPQ